MGTVSMGVDIGLPAQLEKDWFCLNTKYVVKHKSAKLYHAKYVSGALNKLGRGNEFETREVKWNNIVESGAKQNIETSILISHV